MARAHPPGTELAAPASSRTAVLAARRSSRTRLFPTRDAQNRQRPRTPPARPRRPPPHGSHSRHRTHRAARPTAPHVSHSRYRPTTPPRHQPTAALSTPHFATHSRYCLTGASARPPAAPHTRATALPPPTDRARSTAHCASRHHATNQTARPPPPTAPHTRATAPRAKAPGIARPHGLSRRLPRHALPTAVRSPPDITADPCPWQLGPRARCGRGPVKVGEPRSRTVHRRPQPSRIAPGPQRSPPAAWMQALRSHLSYRQRRLGCRRITGRPGRSR